MLAKMFLAGAKNLEVKKEWINELNVFPVPDGDTGTNMTLTIMSAAKEVVNLQDEDMMTICKAISSGSLRGARGNSGVILSQLFRGFTKTIREYEEIDIPTLATATEKAVESAYKAVMKPKEGTILTVAKGMEDKARELSEEGCDDMELYFRQIIEYGDEVLAKTPDIPPAPVSQAIEKNHPESAAFALSRAVPLYFLPKDSLLSVPLAIRLMFGMCLMMRMAAMRTAMQVQKITVEASCL